MVSDLECPACDARYSAGADEPWRCGCGHALEFVDQPYPEGEPLSLSNLDTSRGLWTFYEFLPIEPHVTLYEGFTPLVAAPDWDATFKLEYVFPTGSFKDRGATTTLSRAVELGVETVIEDSSGNAGAAIATYAARAGLPAEIYVPAGVKQSKLMAIQRVGARPVRVEGSREDVTAACVDAVEGGARLGGAVSDGDAIGDSDTNDDADADTDTDSDIGDDSDGDTGADDSTTGDDVDTDADNSDTDAEAETDSNIGADDDTDGGDETANESGHPDAPYQRGPGWYASHAWNPAFYAGTMTFAFELAAQREWTAPDAIVLPIGHGTLFLGAYRGFSILEDAGIVDRLPRLIGVQSAGFDPIVHAIDGDRFVEAGEGENGIADGIQIREPARGTQILDAIEATEGTAVAVGDGIVESALDRLHRGGFYVEPTAAVAPAALEPLREADVLAPSETVVVPLTGSGLKTL